MALRAPLINKIRGVGGRGGGGGGIDPAMHGEYNMVPPLLPSFFSEERIRGCKQDSITDSIHTMSVAMSVAN